MAKRTLTEKQPKASRPHNPDYGIDEKYLKEMLPWSWAKKILSNTQNYFLATVREDGRPHVMPVWGIWLDNRFYFGTGKKSVKARNLAQNSNCVVCVDADEAVIVEGKASKLRDKAVRKKVDAAYLRKYKIDMSTMNEPLFFVRPRVVFGQIEKTYPKTATRWKFD